jgi:hypothetical protein
MTHFPSRERNAFLEWIDTGFSETATIVERYEARDIPADDLLRRFMIPAMCTDGMPGHACEQVATELDYYGDTRGMTYGLAASALLVQRAAGDEAGARYLSRVLEVSQ